MPVELLIGAAVIAANLSASRQKQIDLKLNSEGLLIEGRFYDPPGHELVNASMLVRWRDIVDGRADIERDIRMVDDRLVAAWRQSGEKAGAIEA